MVSTDLAQIETENMILRSALSLTLKYIRRRRGRNKTRLDVIEYDTVTRAAEDALNWTEMRPLRDALADMVAALPVTAGHPTREERDRLVTMLRAGE